jgi:hypothetical protein
MGDNCDGGGKRRESGHNLDMKTNSECIQCKGENSCEARYKESSGKWVVRRGQCGRDKWPSGEPQGEKTYEGGFPGPFMK